MAVYKKINGQLVKVGSGDSFTTSQMDAVNSGITSAKVSKLDALPTASELAEEIASARGKELTGFLTQGQTTLTFDDESISPNTIVDNVVSTLKGLCYEDITVVKVTSTQYALKMTFEKQVIGVYVKVVIR